MILRISRKRYLPMKRSTLKKVSLLLLLAGSFTVDLLIQSPPSLYYQQIQRSIWLFLPETGRSRFPGKYHRYVAVQHEYLTCQSTVIKNKDQSAC